MLRGKDQLELSDIDRKQEEDFNKIIEDPLFSDLMTDMGNQVALLETDHKGKEHIIIGMDSLLKQTLLKNKQDIGVQVTED
jgi:hypothetical protein